MESKKRTREEEEYVPQPVSVTSLGRRVLRPSAGSVTSLRLWVLRPLAGNVYVPPPASVTSLGRRVLRPSAGVMESKKRTREEEEYVPQPVSVTSLSRRVLRPSAGECYVPWPVSVTSLSRRVLRPSAGECYIPRLVMCPSLSRRVLMFHCLYQTRPTKVLKFSIWLIRVLKSLAVVCSPELLLLQPHPACSILVLDSLFAQPLSMSCLVYLFVWSPLHSPYIFSPSQCVVLNKTGNWAVLIQCYTVWLSV